MDSPEDFFEEDETLEERQAAWGRGERGVTDGPRDLNQRARRVIDQVIERWDSEPVTETGLVIVSEGLVVEGNVLEPSPFRVIAPEVSLR